MNILRVPAVDENFCPYYELDHVLHLNREGASAHYDSQRAGIPCAFARGGPGNAVAGGWVLGAHGE